MEQDIQELYKQMGVTMKNLRESRGLTKKELAAALGVSANTYSKYELGERRIRVSIVIKLSQYYDVSVSYLVAEPDKQSLNDNK